jgi:hypothetical protein
MPTIIKPYSGGEMGESLFGIGGLTDAFFGPKASTAAYTREKFKEQQRQNEYTPLLAELYKNPNIDPGLAASYSINAGVTPQTTFGMRSGVNIARMNPAEIDTPANQQIITQNMLTQPGASYTSTPSGVAAGHANAQTIADMTAKRAADTQLAIDARTLTQVRDPATGAMTWVRKSEASGMGAPVTMEQARGDILQRHFGILDTMNPFQRSAISADAGVLNWFVREPGTGKILQEGRTLDGKTNYADGQPLHPSAVVQQSSNPGGANAFTPPATELGKTELKDRREAVLNADAVLDLGTQIKTIVKRNPIAVGATGNLKQIGQEGMDLLGSLNMMFGGGREGGYTVAVNQARNALQSKMGTAGAMQLMPELYDPDPNSIRTMNGMLIYKAAAALGQSGRDASDKDIATVRGLVGDPSSWFQGPTTYNDKISTLMRITAQQRDADHKLLQPGAGIGPRRIKVEGVDDMTAAPAASGPAPPPGFILNSTGP